LLVYPFNSLRLVPVSMFSFGSLRLTPPFGKTLIEALIINVLLVGSLEGAARTIGFEPLTPPPGPGSEFVVFDRKALEMEKLTRAEGDFDCVLVGDSSLFRGVSPEIMSQSYLESTGHPLRCYNFGVGGFRLTESATAATIIAEKFHPQLIIVTTNVVDMADKRSGRLNDNAWVRYRLGEWNLPGWLLDNFYLYRYYTAAAIETQERAEERANPATVWAISASGYSPRTEQPPDSEIKCFRKTDKADFVLHNRAESALNDFVALHEQGQALVLIEFPLSPLQLETQCHPEYEEFRRFLNEYSERSDIPLIAAGQVDQIKSGMWADEIHMNYKGAEVFSQWLGKQLADMKQAGVISLEPGQR
jgi:hypothetical protein